MDERQPLWELGHRAHLRVDIMILDAYAYRQAITESSKMGQIDDEPLGCLETFKLISVEHRQGGDILTFDASWKDSIDSDRAISTALGLATTRVLQTNA